VCSIRWSKDASSSQSILASSSLLSSYSNWHRRSATRVDRPCTDSWGRTDGRHWTTRHVWTSMVMIIFMDWCTEQVIFWIDTWIHSFSGIDRQHWTVASSICTVRRVTAERYNCDYCTDSITYIACLYNCLFLAYVFHVQLFTCYVAVMLRVT